jgi:UDP-GlcNAc:undecaprenyl-phosphate GlcNAc-1-phosphate transferase
VDSGSSVIGFAAAFLGLAFCRETGPAKSVLTPLLFSALVAALPLLDAGLAVLRRVRNRTSPLYGDRRHLYDLLLARGYTARQVALVCYALSAGLVIAGWFVLRLGTKEALVVSALIAGALFGMEVRMGALRSQDSSESISTEGDLRWRRMADQGLRGKA